MVVRHEVMGVQLSDIMSLNLFLSFKMLGEKSISLVFTCSMFLITVFFIYLSSRYFSSNMFYLFLAMQKINDRQTKDETTFGLSYKIEISIYGIC